MKRKQHTGYETSLIEKAEAFARSVHGQQTRDGGEPYIIHPEQVVRVLEQVTDDAEIIAAAWLHDTIEDTETTYNDILVNFGKRVADLVNEVTHEGTKDTTGYYFPRLETRDGILIKFADRLSNLSDMGSWSDNQRAHYLKKSKFWKSEGKS